MTRRTFLALAGAAALPLDAVAYHLHAFLRVPGLVLRQARDHPADFLITLDLQVQRFAESFAGYLRQCYADAWQPGRATRLTPRRLDPAERFVDLLPGVPAGTLPSDRLSFCPTAGGWFDSDGTGWAKLAGHDRYEAVVYVYGHVVPVPQHALGLSPSKAAAWIRQLGRDGTLTRTL